jgi:hypothetical protein
MKILKRSFLVTILFASTLLFATGTSSIVSEDKTNEEIINSQGATDIIDLRATTTSGFSVCNYRIKSLPSSEAGVLYMGDGETAVELNQNLTQDEADELMFDPEDDFVGNATFTYSGIDANGEEGSLATVTLPIIGEASDDNTNSDENNDSSDSGSGITSVTSDDKVNPEMLNTLPAVDILNLSGKDANGVAVNNFIIKSIVDEEAGVLYMADAVTVVEVDQNLSIDEADGLKFDPKEGFVGDAVFTYQAVDVNGNLGNIATVTIPVVGTLTPANPDNNGSIEDCECNDYNKSIPVLSHFGILLMIILTSLAGLFFTRKEI